MKYVKPECIDLSARARTALGAEPDMGCAAGETPTDVNSLTCLDCYAGMSAATCLHGGCPSDDGEGCKSGMSNH